MKKVPSSRRRSRSISYLAMLARSRVRDDIAGANKFLSQSGKGNAKNARQLLYWLRRRRPLSGALREKRDGADAGA